MSEEFDGLDSGPILIFYEDPDEKRQRIEGAQPPPESVRAPRLAGSGQAERDALDYPLFKFPWEPWAQGTETQSLAMQYAVWLNEIGPARLAAFRSLLERAGAPMPAARQEPADLAALGCWFQEWFGLVAIPFARQGFIEVDSTDRLGSAWVRPSPHSQGYSRTLDALIGSLAHDLALVVADSARRNQAHRTWQFAFDPGRQRFVITLEADQHEFDLIEHLVEFIVQSAARPRGAKGRDLKRWYSLTLQRCRDRVMTGSPVPRAYEVFPDFRSDLSYPRRSVSRPQRSDPPATAGLIEAAEKFQEAGWFESVKLSPADLARAVQAAWRAQEREDLPDDRAAMHWRLLLLDGGRTWSEDVEAEIQSGDGVYQAIAESLSHVGLKAVRGLHSTDEDWTSAPGNLHLTLEAQRGKPKVVIPSPVPYISAALFTGLNQLLPDDGPRLWFFDHGSPLGIATRATQDERDALEQLTGISLDRDPPAWWAALAPIPQYAADSKPDRAGQPPKPARQPVSRRSKSATKTGVRADGSRRAAADAPTAKQAFVHLMRDHVAPALRELGFKGSLTRGYFIASGDYKGGFSTQTSIHNTKDEVVFWVHLTAFHRPTNSVYWNMQLLALIPANESFIHWTVRADEPVEPVGEHLLGVFRSYGWPAIQAALDSPGYPPDPSATWARSFAPGPNPAVQTASGPNLGPLTWLIHRGTHRDDDIFADLADTDEIVRMEAAMAIGSDELHDDRAIPALLNRLEFDPSPHVRERAALGLGNVSGRPEVLDGLRASAAEDEDFKVRWAARYGVRLARNAAASARAG
jgi:HEAT repeats